MTPIFVLLGCWRGLVNNIKLFPRPSNSAKAFMYLLGLLLVLTIDAALPIILFTNIFSDAYDYSYITIHYYDDSSFFGDYVDFWIAVWIVSIISLTVILSIEFTLWVTKVVEKADQDYDNL